MSGYIGVLLRVLWPSLWTFIADFGDFCNELCDNVRLLPFSSRHRFFFDSSDAIRAPKRKACRLYSLSQASRHLSHRSTATAKRNVQ